MSKQISHRSHGNRKTLRCMLEKKEIIIYGVDLRKESNDVLKGVMAGMRRRMQVCLQRNAGHVQGNGN